MTSKKIIQVVEFKKESTFCTTPSYGSPGSAGADLAASHYAEALPGETIMVDTGISFGIPEGYYLDIRQRSGLSIHYPNYLANCAGVIDSDFRGTIKIIITNTTKWTWKIQPGDRIAQAILTPYVSMLLQQVDVLSCTERGEGGFGSTGVNIMEELKEVF